MTHSDYRRMDAALLVICVKSLGGEHFFTGTGLSAVDRKDTSPNAGEHRNGKTFNRS